jgi:hypothetical protein
VLVGWKFLAQAFGLGRGVLAAAYFCRRFTQVRADFEGLSVKQRYTDVEFNVW